MTDDTESSIPDSGPWVTRLTRDLKMAAATLTDTEARYLVDLYYIIQEQRKRGANQSHSADDQDPNILIDWVFANQHNLENSIRRAMGVYAASKPVGAWSLSVFGIGPVLAAGLLAHIDIQKAPTVGHIWRFAGLDPTVQWQKKMKRPWNARLKVLSWKIGESFIKVKNREQDLYGHLLEQRKAAEWERNLAGKLSDQADTKLDRFKIGKNTDAWPWYAGCYTAEAARLYLLSGKKVKPEKGEPGSGVKMLPPAHIHSRAKRWAVKLFLAHWHGVAYRNEFGKEPPLPWILEHGGHVHKIEAA